MRSTSFYNVYIGAPGPCLFMEGTVQIDVRAFREF